MQGLYRKEYRFIYLPGQILKTEIQILKKSGRYTA
jgi:hypothetical protein